MNNKLMFFDYQHLYLVLVSHFGLLVLTFVLAMNVKNTNVKIALTIFSVLLIFDVIFNSSYGFIKTPQNIYLHIVLTICLAIGIYYSYRGLKEMYKKKNPKPFINELNAIDYESKMIIDNSQSLVAKIDLNGHIISASDSYAKLFLVSRKSVIGMNIFELNETLDNYNHQWFNRVVTNHSSKDQSKYNINGQPRWVSWHNDVLYDNDGNIEYIICVGNEVTNLMKINEELEFKTNHDSLTQLLNYRGLAKAVKELNNVNKVMCFFIGIHDFVSIQNYYGIHIGDEVLRRLADELNKFKELGHICARLPGSGFVIMIINPSQEETLRVLDEMEQIILKDVQVNNLNIHIKRNIGYAEYPKDTDDIMHLVSLSNLAMNDSATNHHNEISNYQYYMSKSLEANIKIATKLRDAINNSVIDIHFQKIIDTNTGEVEYLEALARWQDVELGNITPDTFIKVAKNSNLIDSLEDYLIKKAIKKFSKLRNYDKYKKTKLAINLSPSSFLHDNFVNLLLDSVLKNNIKAHDVCIEISENTFIHNLDLCKTFITKYREKGFLIAIDDFGKEYSSLSVLGSITYDVIKIDGSFVTKIFSAKNQTIIEMIVKIANLNNNQIIAESVETKDQADTLRQLNCFVQQGYYFHRPEKVV